ncbi:SDR family NAD(P)-dependent oxidoreductase [Polymorphobacter fuscus]|uniref:SDR family NAD(P)-dependent oxidoreductase n=1 Tax=Sandarakinorhabdus fusca TaxID=1439888 RepID=A0A7C9KID4_9SPHN|nr:SDR family NAD(P)-dependent oxidoreductase [Polymorphobacter fuscus]KAB7646353.1 SDR family NAD(P)-dependent oxidoreductase [Polymorphobacter fuscus]MQT17580.1 SDR family NAD(P)-dependent oxidoreductase [Polymorphobacter fuscus]NJC09877.1 NAD(P)-dependent dehydrogenase (short-subunit alcohol dehydrogenase family) [Polymorphobacter fuscus]
MTRLPSFPADLHAVIIGATGGIGAALADHLDSDARVGLVTRLSRHSGFDLTDPPSIAAAAASLVRPPDLVIVATGLLHDQAMAPERDLRALSASAFAHAFAVNATGPALVAQAFLPLLPKGRKTVFAALSARVGSTSDNRLGGWHAYRASKAALNALIRTLAIEQARKNPESIVLALHPGTVDTALSKPFQRNVRTLFTPDVAALHLLAVIDAATPARSGRLIDWQGAEIAP